MRPIRIILRSIAGWVTGNDRSDWDRALFLPHFRDTMPVISFLTAIHFVQLRLSGRFQTFDYGTAKNFKEYRQTRPIDVSEHYRLLREIPIDLIGGTRDGVISTQDVKVTRMTGTG